MVAADRSAVEADPAAIDAHVTLALNDLHGILRKVT
jgi:hypothetical protein